MTNALSDYSVQEMADYLRKHIPPCEYEGYIAEGGNLYIVCKDGKKLPVHKISIDGQVLWTDIEEGESMTNAEWVIQTGCRFNQLRLIQHNELSNRSYTVMLNDKPIEKLDVKGEPLDVFRKWLDAEHKEPILTDEEREYLSMVIKPYRDMVRCIERINFKGESRLMIIFKDHEDGIVMPRSFGNHIGLFDKYTLEELGL